MLKSELLFEMFYRRRYNVDNHNNDGGSSINSCSGFSNRQDSDDDGQFAS